MDTLDAHQLRSMLGKMRPPRPELPPETVGGPEAQQGMDSMSGKISELAKGARRRSLDQLLGGGPRPASAQNQKGKNRMDRGSSPPGAAGEAGNIEDAIQDPILLDATIRKYLGLLVKMLIQAEKKEHLTAILQEHQLFIQDVLDLLENEKAKRQ